MDYTILKTELTTDPKGVGYSQPLAATNDNAVAALLNATTGPGALTLTIQTYTKEQFLTGIMPAIEALGTATAALQAKYQPILQVTLSVSTILYAVAQPILTSLISDGLLTQAEVTAFTTRQGSSMERLYGAGTVAAWTDVAKAMGRM